MFILRKIEGGRINVFEPQILPTETTIKSGQALVLNEGKLVLCAQDAKPTFIALADAVGTSGKPADVHVGRVESNQLYDVAVVSGVTVGGKYKLTTTADGITSTAATTAGAEVVAIGSDFVTVRFA